MAIRLFQYAADTRNMFNGQSKQNQIHWGFAHHVVFFQVFLYRLQIIKKRKKNTLLISVPIGIIWRL